MLSSLSKCIGAHISQWSGDLGLRKAAGHSSAAYYSSLYNSVSVLEEVLGYYPDLSPLLDSCCPLLSKHAARPDWSSHLSIDSQRLLSASIDKASFSSLLSQAPDIRSRVCLLPFLMLHSSTLPSFRSQFLEPGASGLCPTLVGLLCVLSLCLLCMLFPS